MKLQSWRNGQSLHSCSGERNTWIRPPGRLKGIDHRSLSLIQIKDVRLRGDNYSLLTTLQGEADETDFASSARRSEAQQHAWQLL
jgi:hypothetical protein